MAIPVKEALADVPSRDDEEREPQPDPPTPPTDGVEASTTTEEVVNDDSSNTGEQQEEGRADERAEHPDQTQRRFAIQSFNIEGTKFDMACEWGTIHLQARSIRVLTE